MLRLLQRPHLLEPITILDRNATDMAAAEGLVFVKRLKRFTERQGEGFAMLALKSEDAEADHAAFEQAGIGGGPVFRFTRKATLPGRSGTRGRRCGCLRRISRGARRDLLRLPAPRPSVLFQPAYLEHPNGATGIAMAAAVAENPAEFQPIFWRRRSVR